MGGGAGGGEGGGGAGGGGEGGGGEGGGEGGGGVGGGEGGGGDGAVISTVASSGARLTSLSRPWSKAAFAAATSSISTPSRCA